MPRLKRVKLVTDGNVVQMTGYTYSGKGQDVLIGSFGCKVEDLKRALSDPEFKARVGFDLLKSR